MTKRKMTIREFAVAQGFESRLNMGLIFMKASAIYAPYRIDINSAWEQESLDNSFMLDGSNLSTHAGYAGKWQGIKGIKINSKILINHSYMRPHLVDTYFHELSHLIADYLHPQGRAIHGALWWWVFASFGIFPSRVSRPFNGMNWDQAYSRAINEIIGEVEVEDVDAD